MALSSSDAFYLVPVLLKAGADVDARDKHGYTALIVAIILDKFRIVPILLDAGADGNVKDKNGKTALEWARPDPKIVSTLSAWKAYHNAWKVPMLLWITRPTMNPDKEMILPSSLV